MGYASNLTESFRFALIKLLSDGLNTEIETEMKKLEDLQRCLEYRKTDYIFLIQNGFDYNPSGDFFSKKELIDYGKYPGEYEIKVMLPNDYPNVPPKIIFKPLHDDVVSEHVYDDGVCVAKVEHGNADSYWKPSMNVKGALLLSYQVVTGELEKKKESKRSKIPLKGTVFEDLRKVTTTERFVDYFKGHPKFKKIDNTFSWEELAYVASKLPLNQKKIIIDFYKSVRDKNDRTKSGRKTRK